MEAMNPGEVVFGGPTLSTAEVPRRESFDLWASIVSEAMVGCSMEPLDDGPFHGSLTPKVTAESMSIAVVSNSAEIARRNQRHISRAPEPYVIAGLTLSGVVGLTSDEQVLPVPAGAMYLVDGERPQSVRTTAYQGILVRVPKAALLRSAGLGPGEFPSVTTVEPIAHGALVIDFFRRLATLPPETAAVPQLLNAGVELLGAAIAIRRGRGLSGHSAQTLDREYLVRFLRANLADPRLTAQSIAAACGMSRRKLFRAIGPDDGGPMALLRSMRVQHARELLIAGPDRTISSVARACGFATDRHFYRVFRGETGMTPAEYREYILSRPRHA
ncbi:AraC family transcriptional regulator [Nocardia neocaledoniensis]|uniref:AraC family transcriptional regulator n=1 Tax=Nocardia neocaledoniensis TaxID=236511 RepID=UPI0033D7BBBF